MSKIDVIEKHAEWSEKAIEKYLVCECDHAGWVCIKFTSPYAVGYPDRLCLIPGGASVWVEVKSRGKKPSKMQLIRMEELHRIGHKVYVVDSKEAVDKLIYRYTR